MSKYLNLLYSMPLHSTIFSRFHTHRIIIHYWRKVKIFNNNYLYAYIIVYLGGYKFHSNFSWSPHFIIIISSRPIAGFMMYGNMSHATNIN